MPLLRSEWSRPWNEVITVSDASEEGFGVCANHLDAKAVAAMRAEFQSEIGFVVLEAIAL